MSSHKTHNLPYRQPSKQIDFGMFSSITVTVSSYLLIFWLKTFVFSNLFLVTGDFRFRSTTPNDSYIEDPVLEFDLLSPHPTLANRRSPSPTEMGQKPSSLWSKPKISLTWALKNDMPFISSNASTKPSSHEQNKPVLKPNNLRKNSNLHKQSELKQKVSSKIIEPKKNESNLECVKEVKRYEDRRSISPSSSTSTSRMGRRRRLRRARPRSIKSNSTFGYEIQDVDEFLTKASLDSPGNIPMVLSRPCVLYETHTGGPQREVRFFFS